MMKKFFLGMAYVSLALSVNGCLAEKDKELEWDRLMSEGSNYLIRADSGVVRVGYKVLEEVLKDGRSNEREKWFREMVCFSMPTNDMA